MAKKKIEIQTQDDGVRLTPILGIKPGHYLAALYGFAVLIILFWLLLWPGVFRPGCKGVFTSEPQGAAVRIDDVYLGATPCSFFIPKGPHRVDIVLSGFVTESVDIEAPGRLFGSRFFPAKVEVAAVLECPDPAAVLGEGAAEMAAWSFGGEPSAAWQAPSALAQAAYRSGPAFAAGINGGSPAKADEIFKAAFRFAANKAALADVVRAKAALDNGGLPASPLSLLRTAQDIVDYVSDNPQAAAALAGVLGDAAAAKVRASALYTKGLTAGTAAAAVSAGTAAEPPAPAYGGLSFERSDGVSIAERTVTHEDWAAFTEENPRWSEENIEELEAEGLADGAYLSGGEASGEALAVSWYAAQAYCEWLSGKLNLGPAWQIRLPHQAELQAFYERIYKESARTVPVWEWTADPYVPFAFLPAEPWAADLIGSPEKLVMRFDGSGSLPPEACSPFGGFRPVIAPGGD